MIKTVISKLLPSHLRELFISYGIRNFLEYCYYKNFVKKYFIFNTKKLKYFFHLYNTTWRNERAIEIPIVLSYLYLYNPKEVIEVGNVLSHYIKIEHTVVDKYEKAENVCNVDIINFKADRKYKLLISISTLEHIGYDEEEKKFTKAKNAFIKFTELVEKGGTILVTFPVGYNPFLDNFVKNREINFTKIFYYKRISKTNWILCDENEIWEQKYNFPFPAGNGLIVGVKELI